MRRYLHCAVILTTLFITAFIPPARAAEKVDLLLVLAADVSRSVDGPKFKLQREGYAAAVANGRVLEAIRSGRNQRIAILFMEWSGNGNQKVVIDWTVIDGPKAAQGFADLLLELPRPFADRTSISGGIDGAVAQFARAPFSPSGRPSTSPATAPIMPGGTSPCHATRHCGSASPSTDW